MSEKKLEKRKYVKPTLTKVVLNPAQAVLSVCSTATTSAKTGGSTACRGTGSVCTKSGSSGDNAAQC